jgi:hypothetical protein
MAFATLVMTCDLRLLVCSYNVRKQMRLQCCTHRSHISSCIHESRSCAVPLAYLLVSAGLADCNACVLL